MQNKTLLLYVVPAIALAITLLGVLPIQGLKPDWKLQSEPLHSTVEAIGALAGMLMALLLIVRQEDANSKSFLLGLGFLGMGLLDSFHAISAPGSGFVLLHSTAVLVGGMGFALVWLPKLGLYSVRSDKYFKRFAPWLLAVGSVLFSTLVLLYRDAFPAMTADGAFTSAAVAINVSAGLLYLLGALHFFLEYRRDGNTEFYLFYMVSLLFGFSGLTFMYSQLWSDEWWVWHFVRLSAFLAILGYLALKHQSTASELARLNRVYAVLSRTNGAMIRIREPQKLYEEACRIAVEDGRFGMAWAGLLAQGTNTVAPVAQYGTDGKGVPVEDLQRGRGPVSTAVREERQIICNDIERDPWMRPWRDEALALGYRSLAAFPLRINGRVIGALAFYAREQGFFSGDEARLLDELASDVSYAIAALETEQKKRHAEEELRRLNAELEQRVEERTAQLEQANRELEAFSYSVSHDLRAPLRSIDGFSQALLEDCGKKVDEQGRDDISRVRAATAKMAELIDAMLVLSRVTRREMRSEAVDLSGIARAVANELKASKPSRKADFVIADGISAKGDPDMLQAVLQNLIENSWKFTSKHKKARIEFGAVQKDGRTVYFVRDDGAGFDPQYADKLFKAFQRLHATTDFPGIGIGLATVQRIINRHGGKIWAEGAVEKGATFYFTL